MRDTLNWSWRKHLIEEFDKDYFKELELFLKNEREEHMIFPPYELTFSSLNKTPLNKIKVIIVGQDPYHNHGQANGLCFSVSNSVKIPASLRNIYKELHNDLNIQPSKSGDLSKWAHQGVLLLNSILTVRAHQPGSHQNKGWEEFTNAIIRSISEKKDHIVFILWGNYAKQKLKNINTSKHKIISSVHPSPFSARNGFFGSKPFSVCNEYLTSVGLSPISWELDDDCHQLSLLD